MCIHNELRFNCGHRQYTIWSFCTYATTYSRRRSRSLSSASSSNPIFYYCPPNRHTNVRKLIIDGICETCRDWKSQGTSRRYRSLYDSAGMAYEPSSGYGNQHPLSYYNQDYYSSRYPINRLKSVHGSTADPDSIVECDRPECRTLMINPAAAKMEYYRRDGRVRRGGECVGAIGEVEEGDCPGEDGYGWAWGASGNFSPLRRPTYGYVVPRGGSPRVQEFC